MKRIRLLLADDHKIMMHGLKGLLEPEFEVVGTVEDGISLVAEAKRLLPDVVVADITMPMLNGIEAARQIKEADARIKILFLTMHQDVFYAARAFEAGASGYVLKHSAPAELVAALREVLAGKTYVTPMIAGELMDLYRAGLSSQKDFVDIKLTPRQKEILQLLAEGNSAKQIAWVLSISSRTVEFHKYRLMQQLNIKSSAELVLYAVKHGLVSA
jgi:DNA-binding NarL/FixJ family response regulator